MMKLLSFLRNLRNEYKVLKSKIFDIFEQKKEYLVCGQYRIDDSCTIIYNKIAKKEMMEQSKYCIGINCKKNIQRKDKECLSIKLARKLLHLLYRQKISNNVSIYYGQCLCVANGGIKIFDYKNKFVYTFFDDVFDMEKKLDKYKKWQEIAGGGC